MTAIHHITLALALTSAVSANAAEHPEFSGIYPHLAFFNNEGECGTGAVVPWAGRLWAITYAPHMPKGSSDKLYEIDDELKLTVREESIGGTPANRMIHRESGQLFIGPYAIGKEGKVRTIPYTQMLGRPTGNARHLTDPAGKIYYATMEEGLYEVDVKSLAVRTLFHDTHEKGDKARMGLPGYHGKGLYSGQGRVVYANNGEVGGAAKSNPFVPSGALGQWRGEDDWELVRRNQFTEVTGPGGIYGSANPADDPIWSVGWDAKSLILMCLDGGEWHRFRLPKASHSYDGAHGWNTEWPRIREIGESDGFLMTMHGMFWRFPKTFSTENTAGIAPRSTYLKVIGDFCRWGDHVVFGCDDTAKSEFLNKRKAKGEIAGPQSQSNLWFVEPGKLDSFGPVIGRGSVWLNEEIEAGAVSDPFLFAGFSSRAAHIDAEGDTKFTFEVDAKGDGDWKPIMEVDPKGYVWQSFDDELDATWVRVRSSKAVKRATVAFTMGGPDRRERVAPSLKFGGLAEAGDARTTGGVVRARGGNKRTLHFAARGADGDLGLYTLTPEMRLVREDNAEEFAWLQENATIPSRKGVLETDAASVLYIDDKGKRFRLPKGDAKFDQAGPLGFGRLCREVATERDLFNCHGTFYELPAENAGGFSRVRPVSSHKLHIADYCSYRGLLVMSGVVENTPSANGHLIHSDDAKTALWVGAVDDLWELGKPVGSGGPWLDSKVKAGVPSDPYLMTGYDKKSLTLSSEEPTTISAEVDITGTGEWKPWHGWRMPGLGEEVKYQFPDGMQAYWIRFTSTQATTVTAQLRYE